jgi:hypothetical protein
LARFAPTVCKDWRSFTDEVFKICKNSSSEKNVVTCIIITLFSKENVKHYNKRLKCVCSLSEIVVLWPLAQSSVEFNPLIK